MIYIATATAATDVLLPRTSAASFKDAVLELVSTTDRRRYVIPISSIEDYGDYYAITGDFSAIDTTGEYEYHLTAKGEILSTGVASIGKIPAVAADQYVKETEYQQYEQ